MKNKTKYDELSEDLVNGRNIKYTGSLRNLIAIVSGMVEDDPNPTMKKLHLEYRELLIKRQNTILNFVISRS